MPGPRGNKNALRVRRLLSPLVRDEVIWAAGFFDGEGSIMCVRRKGTLQPFHYYLSLTVVQLRREPVDRFRLAVGGIGGVYDQKQQTRVSGEPKRYFQYQAWGSTAQVVFAMLWPWLSTPKREQTEKAVRLVRERQWAGSSREGNR